VTRRERVTADFIDAVTTWLRRTDRGLELVGGVNVGDRLLAVTAD
jgi:hypothetical protein